MTDETTGKTQPTSKDWQELSLAGAGVALQLAMKIDTLERELVIVRTLNEGLLAKVEAAIDYSRYAQKRCDDDIMSFEEWFNIPEGARP